MNTNNKSLRKESDCSRSSSLSDFEEEKEQANNSSSSESSGSEYNPTEDEQIDLAEDELLDLEQLSLSQSAQL